MPRYDEWFAVDVKKRAASVRSRPLAVILKELLANSLDAGAANIELTCEPAKETRRDRAGFRSFNVACVDDGHGCAEPEILRRVGSSTSDLHAETRGRFGQGLIDVLAIAESAEIRTLKHRLAFTASGCQITTIRNGVDGMTFDGVLRHRGDGFDDLAAYFESVIVLAGVSFVVNGQSIGQRQPNQTISGIKLQTVAYDPKSECVRRYQRVTAVEIHDQHGETPMIHELGIPVDSAPWALPFDIDVLQKTPLDVERNMLPGNYKNGLVRQLIEPMSEEYMGYMNEHEDAPPEIKNNEENAERLNEEARDTLIETVTGAKPEQVVKRNPFDPDDLSESQELEHIGYTPINRGSLPAGVRGLLKNAATVAKKHDQVCKPRFRADPDFPPETERQRRCLETFEEIASALVGKSIRCERVRGGNVAAAYGNGIMKLNIDHSFIWDNPLGEQTLGLIIHECCHERVSGHAEAFREECERMGARLARWVGDHHKRWISLTETLYGSPLAVVGGVR